MRSAVLVAAVGLGWGAALGVATAAFGPGHLRPALAALALSLIPAVGTLRLTELAAGHWAATPVLIAGMGLRMAVVVVGMLVLSAAADGFGGRDRLAGWVALMYVLALAAESALAAHAIRAADRPAPLAGGR